MVEDITGINLQDWINDDSYRVVCECQGLLFELEHANIEDYQSIVKDQIRYEAYINSKRGRTTTYDRDGNLIRDKNAP